MTAANIYSVIGLQNNAIISEENFETAAIALIYAASQLTTHCHKSLSLPASTADLQSSLLQTLTGNSTAAEITVLEFDEFLEVIKASYTGSDGGHDHDHEGTEEGDHEEEDDHEDHGHEEKVQLLMEDVSSFTYKYKYNV